MLADLKLKPLESAGPVTAKFDLNLTLQEKGDRIVGGVAYATSLFEGSTIERYMGYLRRLLEGMVGDEQQAVQSLPMLSDSEPLTSPLMTTEPPIVDCSTDALAVLSGRFEANRDF